MDNSTVVDISAIHIGCQNCHLLPFCQPSENSRLEMQVFSQISIRIHKYERGEHLYLVNNKFKTVFVIRSGSVKTFNYAPDGEEQVTGFHLTGKILGLDAIATGQHTQSAVSLETSSICEIPFAKLEEISAHTPQVQHLLFHVMSQEIRDDHYHLTLLSRMPAAARLAGFLLQLSQHFQRRGYSATNFNLSLSRHDIANLLGLAVETVSRLFTQFQDEGLLTVDRKHIVLNNLAGLTKLSQVHSERTRQKTALQNEVC